MNLIFRLSLRIVAIASVAIASIVLLGIGVLGQSPDRTTGRVALAGLVNL